MSWLTTLAAWALDLFSAHPAPPPRQRLPLDLADRLTPEVFVAAFARVRKSPSAGIDGVDASAYAAGLERRLHRLRKALLAGDHRPASLLRFAVRKPGGGRRPLGVPTIADRVAQTAVHLVVAPLVDPLLLPNVHGYRTGRGCDTALQWLASTVGEQPWLELVQVDIASMFDRLCHDRLRGALRTIDDPLWQVLTDRWISRWGTEVGRGVPQGAPLSPLFSNLFLHAHLDLPLAHERPGPAAWMRYADDLVLASARRGGAALLLNRVTALLDRAGLAVAGHKVHRLRAGEHRTLTVLGWQVATVATNGRWRIEAEPGRTQ